MVIPKKKQRKGLTSISILTKRLDKVFSEFIRQRDKGKCFTCPVQREWKYMQAGHYVSRTYKQLRWNEFNVHCQCVGCNVFKKGNLDEYAIQLQRKYGAEHLELLNKQKRVLYTADRKELEERIGYYRKLIKQNGT